MTTDPVTDVARADVVHSLQVLSSGVPVLISAVDDPSRAAVGDWTIGNVVAHLVSTIEMYPPIIDGAGSPITSFVDVPRDEEAAATRVARGDLPGLSDRYAAGAARCIAALRTAPARVAWHGNLPLPIETVVAILASEAAVHGYDIARAAGLAWRIPAEHARIIFRAMTPVLCHYVDPATTTGIDARLRLRLRGDDQQPLVLHFDDGALSVRPDGSGPVDCTLWADPVTWLLTAFGRTGPIRAAVTGGVVAWGRRPWRAFRLASWLRSP